MNRKINPNDLLTSINSTSNGENQLSEVFTNDGLTIRAHFASIAMQGLIMAEHHRPVSHIAKDAVEVADALIQELNK